MDITYYFFWYSWGGTICEKYNMYFLDENIRFVVIYFNKNCSCVTGVYVVLVPNNYLLQTERQRFYIAYLPFLLFSCYSVKGKTYLNYCSENKRIATICNSSVVN